VEKEKNNIQKEGIKEQYQRKYPGIDGKEGIAGQKENPDNNKTNGIDETKGL